MSLWKKTLFCPGDPGAAGHIEAAIDYYCAEDRFEARRSARLVSAGAMISREPLCAAVAVNA
jgi:hypothetical protein